jgi:salicylate hydroxylase
VLGEDIEPIRGDKSYLCRADGAAMKADPITAPLMETGKLTAWWGPGRHIITLPLRQDNMYDMIVVFDPAYEGKPETPLHTNWTSKGDVNHLREGFTDHEIRLRKTLEYVPADECRLWNILSLPDLPTWVSQSGKIVLLGDAAHAMRPYLAQLGWIYVPANISFLTSKLGSSNGHRGWCNAGRMSVARSDC